MDEQIEQQVSFCRFCSFKKDFFENNNIDIKFKAIFKWRSESFRIFNKIFAELFGIWWQCGWRYSKDIGSGGWFSAGSVGINEILHFFW